ncbi:MAG: hypothetical protein KGJ82_19925 [Nitrospirota bacterium]|nr:hypothetical protein [Nitrospirota bacterium]
MSYSLLRFLHLLGLILMGAGLIGVWYEELRSWQIRDQADAGHSEIVSIQA